MKIKPLIEHIPDYPTNFRSRVLNALWREVYPTRLLADRPDDWEPDISVIAGLKLELIPHLGLTGRRCVEAWIKERCGYPPTSAP